MCFVFHLFSFCCASAFLLQRHQLAIRPHRVCAAAPISRLDRIPFALFFIGTIMSPLNNESVIERAFVGASPGPICVEGRRVPSICFPRSLRSHASQHLLPWQSALGWPDGSADSGRTRPHALSPTSSSINSFSNCRLLRFRQSVW